MSKVQFIPDVINVTSRAMGAPCSVQYTSMLITVAFLCPISFIYCMMSCRPVLLPHLFYWVPHC